MVGEEAADRFLTDLLLIAEWVPDAQGAPLVAVRDPDDEYLLALARSADVDVLVSGDRDLTDLTDAQPPIDTPTQLFKRIG